MTPSTPSPPNFWLRFLRWFCSPAIVEDVEGDLIELFRARAANHPKKAKWLFIRDVLFSCAPASSATLKSSIQ
ncbi:MAG: hypothetical protein HC811_04805 [Flammeovirgaceae bacterium]|nr:hypothetical protein [Flammeovirgaceae bacterium]